MIDQSYPCGVDFRETISKFKLILQFDYKPVQSMLAFHYKIRIMQILYL